MTDLRAQDSDLIAEIETGDRRKPAHAFPEVPEDASEQEKWLVEQVRMLGLALDFMVLGPWSIELRSDTQLRAWYHEGSAPVHGCRWSVYYNAAPVGWMEIGVFPDALDVGLDVYKGNPHAQLHLELEHARWVPWHDLRALLSRAALLMSDNEKHISYLVEDSEKAAEAALIEYMWECQRLDGDHVPSLEFLADGPWRAYTDRRRQWESDGIDLLKKSQR